jgi:NTE family protein
VYGVVRFVQFFSNLLGSPAFAVAHRCVTRGPRLETKAMLRPKRFLATTTLLLLQFPALVHADESCHAPATGRPSVGLVLGGGGARGIAHIGVIRVLEELRIPIDYVAGTSGGAIIGGMFATGMNSNELQEVIEAINWVDIFSDNTNRADRPFRRKRDDDLALFGPKFGVGSKSSLLPKGAISGQKITFYFQTVSSQRVQTKDFDALPIPFRAIAGDIVTGEVVVIDHGDLATAMRASASIPGLFLPIKLDDRLLVDGGIVKNLPVDVVKAMGADVVIAVDVGTPLSNEDELGNFVAITNQLSNILVVHNTVEQKKLLGPNDVLIVPPLGDEITSVDFARSDLSIPIGYGAADALRDRLAPLALSEDDYAAYHAGIERCVSGPPTIEFVRLDNQSRFADRVIEERLHVDVGAPLDKTQLETDIQQIYALGFLEKATYEVVDEDGRKGLLIAVQQDSRGRQFIETGLDFYGTSDSSELELRLAYLKTDVDAYGAEFRAMVQLGENQGLLAELYQPMNETLKMILLPRLFAERRQLNVFDDSGNTISQIEIQQLGTSLALGREFWRHASLFGGVRRYGGDIQVNVGDPDVPKGQFDGGEWFVDGTFDRLDSRYFPSKGTFADFEYAWSRQSLGADTDFQQLAGTVFRADTWKQHTLMFGGRVGLTMEGNAPTQNLFRAGGVFNMSGFEPDELTGQNFGMALIGYRYRLTSTGFLPPFVGGTVEYGNAAEDRDDVFDEGILNGSVYFGWDSPIGPLYMGYGFAEDDRRAYFLRIGNILGDSSFSR